MSIKQTLLESFFEKGERPKDETAEDSKTANKRNANYLLIPNRFRELVVV